MIGLEPYLYECLASTFQQTYPHDRLTIYFCIPSREDPAFSTLERLLVDFPTFDSHIYVEEEDPKLSGGGHGADNLGPNPKIRNMSRAYNEAKSDIVWIVDCNVWIGESVAASMTDLLCGLKEGIPANERKFKFVHQLPLSADLSKENPFPTFKERLQQSGGLLEEMFLSISHAKFYTAINTVAVAPCIVGKSNMFRRSHLNALTVVPTEMNSKPNPPCGTDHFSYNICEDHLIGGLLWYSPVPATVQDTAQQEGFRVQHLSLQGSQRWGNHAMLPPVSPENLAIQPMVNYPLRTYIDRRVRWLRVRKFTVFIATLIEPGTESLLCSVYGAFALTSLPWINQHIGIPQTWTAFLLIWLANVFGWACMDRWVWGMLQRQGVTNGPPFPRNQGTSSRPLSTWILAWLGREMLAFPVWAWAFFGGVTVDWRGRKFWVSYDMQVHEISPQTRSSENSVETAPNNVYKDDTGSGGESGRKRRQD